MHMIPVMKLSLNGDVRENFEPKFTTIILKDELVDLWITNFILFIRSHNQLHYFYEQ